MLRLDVTVSQGSRSGTAAFSRDKSNNDYKFPAVMGMPPTVGSQPHTQLAIDLPVGLTGMVMVRCQSEKIPPPSSGGAMSMTTLATEGCAIVTLTTDMPSELSLNVQAIPASSCATQ